MFTYYLALYLSIRNCLFCSDDEVPPPLPPHGIPMNEDDNQVVGEYRPPVPPHRNVGVTVHVNTIDNSNNNNLNCNRVCAFLSFWFSLLYLGG